MFAVTVTFIIHPGQLDGFLTLVRANAETSLKQEEGCKQFDVCVDPERPNEIFLYELYDDAAAFDIHLNSAHFKVFDSAVAGMVESKTATTYRIVN